MVMLASSQAQRQSSHCPSEPARNEQFRLGKTGAPVIEWLRIGWSLATTGDATIAAAYRGDVEW